MDNDEIYSIMFMGFMLGLVGLVYYPGIVAALLPYLALLGAFYLGFGLLARMTGFAFGIGWSRKEDWMNGLVILVLVGLIFGNAELAVYSVQYMVRLFTAFLGWILNIV